MGKQIKYKDAGVDIAAGEKAVERIKGLARSTFTPQVLTDIGKFGGFYAPDWSHYQKPVLVSSIDGVGTKLKVAFMVGKHDTVGEDLVNHCVNDILTGGARPLFFLDYIATGKLKPHIIEEIITGMSKGCKRVGCSLVGGEMAEMPDFYRKGEYDIAGCIVGLVEKNRIVDGGSIQRGDVLIGLPSDGLHTNGYSLARKVLFEIAKYRVDTFIQDLEMTVGDELLRIHRCYYPLVYPLLEKINIQGMAHVTGGGIVGNTKRILPAGLTLRIEWGRWEIPPIFKIIQHCGHIADDEMRKIFNLGIGYILVVEPNQADNLMENLLEQKEKSIVIGKVV
ncbi:phosphoribosylformylglycinamidine cyclo-ligase [bacterium]|nr:phosphoribosylformylglycinamidine cyclo-ligase [bacterium]